MCLQILPTEGGAWEDQNEPDGNSIDLIIIINLIDLIDLIKGVDVLGSELLFLFLDGWVGWRVDDVLLGVCVCVICCCVREWLCVCVCVLCMCIICYCGNYKLPPNRLAARYVEWGR
jgi:hypothetical protein